MTAKGVTQKVLAEAMGVQQSAVSKWLAGETIPSADNLSALADYFQVVPAELIDDGTAVAAHKPLRFADSDGAARKLDEVKRGDPERYEFLVETIETQLRKMKEKQTKRT